jgi:sugar phosphate isomerase/epimerase
MSEVTTYRWSFEQDVKYIAAAGYESIGVWRQKLSDFGEEEGIDLLLESGLNVSHLSWAGGFTGSDGQGFQDAVDDGFQAIRLAGALNAGCLLVFPGGRNHHILRHAERLFRLALEQLLSLAEAADVTLAMEPMHPACSRDWTFLTDVQSALTWIEDMNSPCLKLVLDTYHFGQDRSLLANLAEVVPHLALVQLGDRCVPHTAESLRCPLGTGYLPLLEIVTALGEAGYTGAFDVELPGVASSPDGYQQLLIDTRKRCERLLPIFSGLRK